MRAPALVVAAVLVAALGGCRRDMQDQPRYEAYETSAFFPDGRASRPPVPGTVARGQLDDDEVHATGRSAAGWALALPMPLTRAVLERGQERFDVYCAPCHDRTGGGAGMIVQRGFKQPASFHEPRLRALPVGYFFDVMTNGVGAMPSYGAQVPADDRWAIAGYVRALQLSQRAPLAELPPAERARVEAAAAAASSEPGTRAPRHGGGVDAEALAAPHDAGGHDDAPRAEGHAP